MKQKQTKETKKRVRQFQTLIGFRQPYQILSIKLSNKLILVLTDTINHILNLRLDIKSNLQSLLNGNVVLYVTHCQMDEVHQGFWYRKLENGDYQKEFFDYENLSGIRLYMKRLNRINCNHKPSIGALSCITSVISILYV